MSVARLIRGSRGSPQERRKSPRTRCRLHCAIEKGRTRVPARVVDVSEGGLGLLSPIELQPKRTYRLRIDVPSLGSLVVEAVAWHARRVKTTGLAGAKKVWGVGMMVSDPPQGFEALLPGGSVRASREALGRGAPGLETLDDCPLPLEGAEPPPPAEDAEDPAEEIGLFQYRIRVKALNGPRTRVLTVPAASLEEAEALAHAGLDDSWKVLEVSEA